MNGLAQHGVDQILALLVVQDTGTGFLDETVNAQTVFHAKVEKAPFLCNAAGKDLLGDAFDDHIPHFLPG